MDAARLKAEIDTDPAGLGYKVGGAGSAWKSDAAIADLLNAATRTQERGEIEAAEFMRSMAYADYNALQAGPKDWLKTVVSAGKVDLRSGGQVRTQLETMFAPGTATRQALAQLAQRPTSRADEVGLGEVYPAHVREARA